MLVLVTGAAGFIGFHVAQRLLREGHSVLGVDNLNAYYDPALKQARLQQLLVHPQFRFERVDLADAPAVASLFAQEAFERVIHLAAQAGVRYSLEQPQVYVQSNVAGFLNVLEGCRVQHTPHLVYASSSSVYGANTKQPFAVTDNTDHPVSLYAATKRANELMAWSYAHLYVLPVTGLRFFTVYGPWGRPDMAYFKFVRAILAGEPIDVYNHGNMRRDFTYIDDVVEGVVRVMDHIPPAGQGRDAVTAAPAALHNIGNNQPVSLLDFISTLESALGRKASVNLLPLQPGDAIETWADIASLQSAVDYAPSTPLAEGIGRFVDWYRARYSP